MPISEVFDGNGVTRTACRFIDHAGTALTLEELRRWETEAWVWAFGNQAVAGAIDG
jgi:hypothetical protein